MNTRNSYPARFLNSVFTFLLVTALSLAGQPDKDISIQTEQDFPVIRIANPAGKTISIQPVSSETGSIGFERNGKTVWISGQPVIEKDRYTWKINSGLQLQMQASPAGKDLDVHLSLSGNVDNMQPTRWFINFAAVDGEFFTGAFERVVDGPQTNSWAEGIQTALDLRDQIVEMKLKPTVSAYAPFYLSSAGYGFFLKGTWPGVFDFCKSAENSVQISFEGPDLRFKLYRGSPMEIVRKHAMDSGPAFQPPLWAFGPWRWRDDHNNKPEYYDGAPVKAPFNSTLVEDILMMNAWGIPCTAYWIDRPWAKGSRGFDDYEFDPERFPNPEKLIAWLNEKDIELMMWIAPFVMGDMANEAKEKGFALKSKDFDTVPQVLMDFTNPQARLWWGEKGPAKLARIGIRGFKLDRADGEKLLDSLDLRTFAGTTYRENYNDFPRQYVAATYEAVQPVLGDDFLLFPRAQYTGSARYGGLWAGDTDGRPEGLRSAIIGLQRCAVMGYPVWGSDTGGYWGKFSRETAMRWLGFSCFTPLMEVGPTNNEGFWNNPGEPHYDTQLIAVWRLYAKTRMKLQTYIHNLSKEAAQTGTPIARPLFLVYPDQPEAWKDWQTFLLGPDILVSAVWESGKTAHSLYLPAGESWIDGWNPERIMNGGQTVKVKSPVYQIPFFIRKGANIDLGSMNKLYEESLKLAAQTPNLAELEKKEGWGTTE